ncbi:hypothetical protein BDZ97DRAFT_1847595 [Flammula alnicola]|nr:hypothetical protein BDZ97DRAFT_1849333 [Flammula alnicola]KAF8957160.1 hypothetical protein BDZ97DRAFT_1847595 [Flammula alnicola]
MLIACWILWRLFYILPITRTRAPSRAERLRQSTLCTFASLLVRWWRIHYLEKGAWPRGPSRSYPCLHATRLAGDRKPILASASNHIDHKPPLVRESMFSDGRASRAGPGPVLKRMVQNGDGSSREKHLKSAIISLRYFQIWTVKLGKGRRQTTIARASGHPSHASQMTQLGLSIKKRERLFVVRGIAILKERGSVLSVYPDESIQPERAVCWKYYGWCPQNTFVEPELLQIDHDPKGLGDQTPNRPPLFVNALQEFGASSSIFAGHGPVQKSFGLHLKFT